MAAYHVLEATPKVSQNEGNVNMAPRAHTHTPSMSAKKRSLASRTFLGTSTHGKTAHARLSMLSMYVLMPPMISFSPFSSAFTCRSKPMREMTCERGRRLVYIRS